VLLGSYGEDGFRIAPELPKLLDTDPEPVDLELYEEANRLDSSTAGVARKPEPSEAS
jgi:hypothetical protein